MTREEAAKLIEGLSREELIQLWEFVQSLKAEEASEADHRG